MIVQENIVINKLKFVRHFSDSGMFIRKAGTDEIYEEAIDLLPCNFEYIETDEKIETNETEEL